VWVKQAIAMGNYFRMQHELLLIGTRGNMQTPAPAARPSSIVRAPRAEHSAKPVEFYQIIESFYPKLPKIELFCRKARHGWAAWGNQIMTIMQGTDDIPSDPAAEHEHDEARQ
jgi:N6-adenosine-specific RNA methylase IME4